MENWSKKEIGVTHSKLSIGIQSLPVKYLIAILQACAQNPFNEFLREFLGVRISEILDFKHPFDSLNNL